jgi:hypothetical protein
VDPLFGTIRNSAWMMGVTIFGGLALLLLISFIGLGRAVAVIQEQNENLRHALDEIFKANRIKDDLIVSLAHEFRNPDAVRSYAELLIDGAFGDPRNRVSPSAEKMRNTSSTEALTPMLVSKAASAWDLPS